MQRSNSVSFRNIENKRQSDDGHHLSVDASSRLMTSLTLKEDEFAQHHTLKAVLVKLKDLQLEMNKNPLVSKNVHQFLSELHDKLFKALLNNKSDWREKISNGIDRVRGSQEFIDYDIVRLVRACLGAPSVGTVVMPMTVFGGSLTANMAVANDAQADFWDQYQRAKKSARSAESVRATT